jgi:alcohol dehydrogenase class IV
LISEPGASSQLGTHISQQFPTVRRVLLVTYPGFLSTGLVDTPLRSLQQAGIEVHVFSGVQADPPEAVVLAAVHALAYPIGGMFHVPHGLSNALVLPHVLRFNLGHATPLYAELAAIVAPQASGSEEARAQALIEALQALAAETGIVRTLREVGIDEADLDGLAEAAMQQTRLLGNNPRTVTLPDARAIYAAAW